MPCLQQCAAGLVDVAIEGDMRAFRLPRYAYEEAPEASQLAAALGEDTPENGYPGEYVQELARIALERRPDLTTLPRDEAIIVARDIGYDVQLQEIKDSLKRFNVEFDVWFSESSLHESGAVARVIRDVETARALLETSNGGAVTTLIVDCALGAGGEDGGHPPGVSAAPA